MKYALPLLLFICIGCLQGPPISPVVDPAKAVSLDATGLAVQNAWRAETAARAALCDVIARGMKDGSISSPEAAGNTYNIGDGVISKRTSTAISKAIQTALDAKQPADIVWSQVAAGYAAK